MRPVDAPLATALSTLRTRWGTAAVRVGGGVHGALALAPDPVSDAGPIALPGRDAVPADDVVPTGFPALDAVLGIGGLPRETSATIRGDASSGKTTLALRWMAEAQLRGAIVAYLDLARSFDPLEAVSRGVDLRWLIVLHPTDPTEGFSLAGALLSGRTVDLLVVDLPARLAVREEAIVRRLGAHVRRVGARLIVLEPATLAAPLHGALAETSGLRLELVRREWIRRGRDVVGQQTSVTVAKNRFGPPGRRVELEIRYAGEGAPTVV